ncbi:MAG: hypothetical protein Q9227_002002 [Pyrenula ochraceoflavens]
MHQHPRPPPVTASPANSERTNPTRTNNSRDGGNEAGPRQLQGLGIQEAFDTPPDHPSTPAGSDISRLNQVIQMFHTKAALIILHSRARLSPAYAKASSSRRVNKWFNVELDETEDYRDEIKLWKSCDAINQRPPPLVIEVYLDASDLGNNQSLVIVDEHNRRCDVLETLAANGKGCSTTSSSTKEVILERWTVALGGDSSALASTTDLTGILPMVYKKSIVLFRSLFTFTKFLPAYKLSKRLSTVRGNSQLKLRYRILEGNHRSSSSTQDALTIPLCESDEKVANDYDFGSTDSPAGPFSVRVTYRNSCEFRVDDAEALLSSQLLGTDTGLFKPSLPRDDSMQEARHRSGVEAGSLPVKNRGPYEEPDRGQAYGSLSTFHQLGPGTSPISALRHAQELGSRSPEVSPTDRTALEPRAGQTSRPSSRPGDHLGNLRRPSVTFQPFKAGSLSSSPAPAPPTGSSPRTSQVGISTLSALKEARGMPPPAIPMPSGKPSVKAAETVVGSDSSSPKPAPITRYSSSFSHRRGRWSSGGNKMDEDQNSSGKASATSSAQRGSGQGHEKPVASSGSTQEDDDNISDFLKMLEAKRDLLTPADSAAIEASTKRTAAQLNRFSRLRDSTNALSDSMSSSLHLHRSSSSSSRQLSSVPPMVAATSLSTSSSPGKPISPHTPHTPAIPSRLSANSIVEYEPRQQESRRHRLSHGVPASPSDETTSEETATQTQETDLNPNAIPIPTSPRPFVPAYRRSSSVAQRRAAVEDEMGDLYGMRSASMGAETQPLTLSALLGQQEEHENAAARDVRTDRQEASSSRPRDMSGRPSSFELRKYTPASTTVGDGATSGSASGGSSTHGPYRSRYSRGGAGRGLGSTHGSSSSLVAGNPEYNRGSGIRHSYGRDSKPENRFDLEDEQLLFAMSDIRASRRSLEEARAGGDVASRRGNRNSRGGRPGSAGSGGNSVTGNMPGGFPGWS